MSWVLRNRTLAFVPLRSTCIWSWSLRDWVLATSASPPPKYLPAAPRASFASSWSTRAAATGADSPSHTPGKRVWGMKGKEWWVVRGSVNARVLVLCCFEFFYEWQWISLGKCYGSVECDVTAGMILYCSDQKQILMTKELVNDVGCVNCKPEKLKQQGNSVNVTWHIVMPSLVSLSGTVAVSFQEWVKTVNPFSANYYIDFEAIYVNVL